MVILAKCVISKLKDILKIFVNIPQAHNDWKSMRWKLIGV